jgi:hypothetical protein
MTARYIKKTADYICLAKKSLFIPKTISNLRQYLKLGHNQCLPHHSTIRHWTLPATDRILTQTQIKQTDNISPIYTYVTEAVSSIHIF